MTIDLLIPTRGRGLRVLETIYSAYHTAESWSQLRCSLYIDKDDKDSYPEALLQALKHITSSRVSVLCGPRLVLSEAWNQLAARSLGDILMHAADDLVFKTKGWDNKVLSAFDKADPKDGLHLVYANDGLQGKKLATHSFQTREAYRVFGRLVPPYFKCDWNDVWLHEVYERCGRLIYLSNVKITHQHYTVDASKIDDTYREARAHEKESTAKWHGTAAERDADVQRLKNAIQLAKEIEA